MIFLIFLLVGLMGGTTGSLIKLAGLEIPPILLTIIRFGLSFIFLIPFIFWQGIALPKTHLKLLIFSCLAFAGNVILFAIGIQHTSVIMSQIIYVPTSLIVAVFGYLLLREKLSSNQFLGLFVTLIGLTILAIGSFQTQDIRSLGEPRGNLLILIALFLWATYLLTSRKLSKDYSPLAITFYNSVIGYAAASFIILFQINELDYHFADFPSLSQSALFLSAITSTSFIFLYQKVIKNTSAFVASLITYINPVAASFIGVTFFHESLNPSLIIGTTIVFVGVFIATSYNYVKGKIKRG